MSRSCSYDYQASPPRSRSISPVLSVGDYSYESYQSDGSLLDYVPRMKRTRRGFSGREDKVDRISKLPDSIILRILSFLEAEGAVRSGVLSKRFAYLWRSVDRLIFSYSSVKVIHNTLFFHKLSNLEKFSVRFNYQDKHYTNYAVKFDRWIRILSLSNVKDLTLEFEGCDYTLPQHFNSNSSIEKLNLSSCRINSNGFVNWESLKSLSMSDTDMDNSTITDVLLGCPSLELLDCEGFTRISLINNKHLRKLVIRNYREVGARLEILAPYLESFVLSGRMKRFRCRVISAESLVDCCLDFCVESYSNENKDKAIGHC